MRHAIFPLKLYLKYRANWAFIGFAVLTNLSAWFWISFNIHPQEELIFLHYNILFGIDNVGEWWKVYYLPVIGFLIIVVNFFFGWLTFNRDKFVALILNSVSAICNICLLIAASLLVFLNV